MKDWIMEVCPEIAEWQAEVIAVQVRISVEAEREECAKVAEKLLRFYTQAVTGVPEAIRARGEK